MAANKDAVHAVIGAIDEHRLWRRHLEIARYGASGRGGVNRQALSAEDIAARQQVIAWASARGFGISVDAIGNLFIRRAGADPSAAPIVAGSHLDTQPTGGNFDGVYGVLAAVEVLEALSDAGVATTRPLEAAIWTNEEGSRFQPATMGSAVFAGRLDLAAALDSIDRYGVAVALALAQTLDRLAIANRREFRFPAAAYLEAHIEQGPRLWNEHRQIGVVTGIQGLRQFRVEVRGEEAHAGTTPRSARRDALAAAVEMIHALRELMTDEPDALRFTVGRMEVRPNSPNTVPSYALFTVDLRHPDRQVLGHQGDLIEQVCSRHAEQCAVGVVETLNSTPVRFDRQMIAMVRSAATHQNLPHLELVSGATHDARFMADLYPTAMIFVPCERGISHSESEMARPGDLAAGARVLGEVMVALAND